MGKEVTITKKGIWGKRDNEGVLFNNKFKTFQGHPDLTGTCIIMGVPFKIGMWKNKAAHTGTTYFKLKFTLTKLAENEDADDIVDEIEHQDDTPF